MESKVSSTLHVQRVIVLLYMGSHRFLPNSTDMHQKASAGLGLHVAMVYESYQCVACEDGDQLVSLWIVKYQCTSEFQHHVSTSVKSVSFSEC
jgi:hypothetical protein